MSALNEHTEADGATVFRQAYAMGRRDRFQTAGCALPVRHVAGLDQGQEPGQLRRTQGSRGTVVIRFANGPVQVQDGFGWRVEAHMGVLLVKCPKTGKMFSTGIQADAETVKNLPEVQSRSRGPHCRSDHLWRPGDTVFTPALAPFAWVENQRPPDDIS
jgi:hypothetical protein